MILRKIWKKIFERERMPRRGYALGGWGMFRPRSPRPWG